MKRPITITLLSAAALLAHPAFARGGHAGGHFGGGAHFGAPHFGGHIGFGVRSHPVFVPRARIFIGGAFVGAPLYYYGAPYYYAPPVVYAPPAYSYYSPPVIVPPASGYVEQPPAASASTPDAWWYYCAEQKAYYPYVKECPGGWQKVPPAPPPS